MYIPNQFNQQDFSQIQQLMAEFPLATVIASSADGIEVSHVPLYFEKANNKKSDNEKIDNSTDNSEYGFLYGHIAKVNPLYQMASNEQDSHWLVVFQDMGHYISPNWYPNKAITHKEVPTWNYRSVHCKVKPSFITDPVAIKNMVAKLSDIHEVNEPIPWSLDEAPEKFVNGLCKAIVGFQLEIIEIQAQFKLSQNKDIATKMSVIDNLQQLDTDDARRMAKQIEQGL